MKQPKFTILQEHLPRCNPCFYYLLAVGILEFLLMTCGLSVYYEHKNYLIFPVLMFFGAAFMQKLTASAKRKLLLGSLAVFWFLIIQKHRNFMGWEPYPFSWFPAIYLMAYPFASVTNDGEENKGLLLYGYLFLAAAFVLSIYGLLLFFDRVPTGLITDVYYHDGSRFYLMRNPNICGCIFMIALLICTVLLLRTKSKAHQGILIALFCLFFFSQSLTNSRTNILITCALLAGILFFRIFNGGWKSFAIGLVAAAITVACVYCVSDQIYTMHKTRLYAKYTQMIQEIDKPAAAVSEDPSPEGIFVPNTQLLSAIKSAPATIIPLSAEVPKAEPTTPNYDLEYELIKIEHFAEARTYSSHLGTLSGRTPVWWAALRSIREDSSILIWGCEHVGDTVSLYTDQPYDHTHNSWAEITLSLGLPGALISVVFTWIAFWNAMVLLWNRLVPLWKKATALLVLGLLLAGFLEPYLFFSNQFFHFIDFIFFLCLGYVRVWAEALPRKFDTKKFPFYLL